MQDENLLKKLKKTEETLLKVNRELQVVSNALAQFAELQDKWTEELKAFNAVIKRMTANINKHSNKLDDVFRQMEVSISKDQEQRILNELKYQESIKPLDKN